jgi:hypothetical protein
MVSEIPIEELKDISGKKVEFVNIIFDEQSNIVYLKKWKENFFELPKQKIYHYFFAPISAGKYKCRVVIRNLETGKGAVASASVKIPKPLDFRYRLNPPLLLVAKKNALYLNIEGKTIRDKPFSLLNNYHYDSSVYAPLIGSLERGRTKIYASIRYSTAKLEQPNIRYSAQLLQLSTGEKIPLTSVVIDRYQDIEAQVSLLEFNTEGLSPGKYFLYIFAKEASTKSISHVYSAFTLE